MPCSNITKIFRFVIAFAAFCLSSACAGDAPSSNKNNALAGGEENAASEFSSDYGKPKIVGEIQSAEITESSGLVASGCNENAFWTHNDSDGGALIYAFDRTGKKLGTWRVADAKNVDWEDMATFRDSAKGECFLYIGDIGNNAFGRGEMTVYILKEPPISAASAASSRKNPLSTETAEKINFQYPDARRDAESIAVHPQTGDVYILSKNIAGASAVYKLAAAKTDANKTNEPEKIADFSVPAMPAGFLTGAAVSPDGRRVAVCDYFGGYEIVLPEAAKNFDEIWKQKPVKIELGARAQGEAIAYSPDGKMIYATSEKKNSPIIAVERK